MLMAQGPSADEVGHVRSDGTTFPTQMTTSVFVDSAGQPAGYITVARDITEIKQAQQELELRRSHFQRVLESMPVAVDCGRPGRHPEFSQPPVCAAVRL